MSTAVPKISVVIPTRGAPPSIARTLNCLACQTLPAGDYEVIVVGGVTEEEVWQNVPADLPYTVRVLSKPGPGPARRRNAGAAAARSEVVLFLDDDMAPEPELLEAHCRAHADGKGNRVVMGYLPPTSEIGSEGRVVDWFKAQLRDWWEDVFTEMARPDHRFCYTDVMSGNLSLPTSLFLSVGGFMLPTTCREDYELGMRLLQAGAELTFCAQARSWHEDKTDEKRLLHRKTEEGKADVLLARMYPELRSTLHLSKQFTYLLWPSRLLRLVTRIWPTGADRLAALLLPLLILFERLRIRSLWRIVMGGMLVHAYWRGILTEAKSWDEVRTLATPPPPPPLASIDLAEGIRVTAAELDRCNRNGVQLTWRNLPLTILPYAPGAEPVRSRHLYAWLDESGALTVRRAEALYAALGIDRGVAVYTSPERPRRNRRKPAMVTEIDLDEGIGALSPLLARVSQLVFVRQGSLILGWLNLEEQATPRTHGDVLQAMFKQLDHTLLLASPAPVALSVPVP